MENVKVIKLSETKIDIDGIIYVREQPAFSPKKGQWIIGIHKDFSPKLPSIALNSPESDHNLHYDDQINGEQEIAWEGYTRLATDSEVEAHLIEVAEQKGFKGGQKLERVNAGCSSKIDKWDRPEYVYEKRFDRLLLNGTGIYQSGKWATIVKKQLPKTKEEFGKFLGEWANRHCSSVNEFLQDYED